MSTSTRMDGEFLRLLFLQAHRETETHFTAFGMPLERNQSDSFRFKRILPVPEEQSRTRGGQAAAMRINLNIEGCVVVTPNLHAPSHAPLLLPLLLSHNLPLPRVH